MSFPRLFHEPIPLPIISPWLQLASITPSYVSVSSMIIGTRALWRAPFLSRFKLVGWTAELDAKNDFFSCNFEVSVLTFKPSPAVCSEPCPYTSKGFNTQSSVVYVIPQAMGAGEGHHDHAVPYGQPNGFAFEIAHSWNILRGRP